MKKISVLGLIGSVIGLISTIILFVLLGSERVDIVSGVHMILSITLFIVNLILLILFGLKRNGKTIILTLSGISILSAFYIIISIMIKSTSIETPMYVGIVPFILCGVFTLTGNIISASSTLEK